MAGSPQAGGAFLPGADYDLTGQVRLVPTAPANTPVISTVRGNASATTVTPFATDTYLAGSAITVPSTGFLANARYTCVFDMTKTAAGTATAIAVLRIGTGGGVVGDTAILTFTFAAGTAAVDSGKFTITAHFRTVGGGTVAVVTGLAECSHALAVTGLISTGASGYGVLPVTSSGFDSTVAGLTIGVSFNGGTNFAGTCTLVEAELRSY